MTLPSLTVIPAGAGSGKTYTLQQRLGDWVRDGLVAPERIVAVTFTEASAAELRERISAKLLAMGRADDALRLDQAYISTIHGFGLRVLTEFAFEGGTSPQPRLLNEDEQNILIRLALSQTDKADEIMSNLAVTVTPTTLALKEARRTYSATTCCVSSSCYGRWAGKTTPMPMPPRPRHGFPGVTGRLWMAIS